MHVYNRGVDGMRIFNSDDDYDRFLRFLGAIKARSPFELFAYCLMPNHFHLLIRVLAANISAIMQALQTRHALHFNRENNRRGPVFQNRFKSPLCHTDSYLLQLVRYIHQNPLPSLVGEVGAWKWSSHHDYLGKGRGLADPSFPLSILSANPANALQQYLALIDQPCPEEMQHDIESSLFTCERAELKEVPRVFTEPNLLSSLADSVANATGISVKELQSQSRRKQVCAARNELIKLALRDGHRAVEIAAFMNRSPAIVWREAGREK